MTMTFFPNQESPAPIFAVVVVLPTPPYPDVITITSPMNNLLVSMALFHAFEFSFRYVFNETFCLLKGKLLLAFI